MGQVNVNPPPPQRGGMGCGFLAGMGTGLTLVVLLVVLVVLAAAAYLVYSLVYGGLNVNVNVPA